MWNKCVLGVTAALLLTAPASAKDSHFASRWSRDATRDVEAMHDLIRDNHPGPVDPANPGFRRWLEDGRTKALVLAHKAQTRADYWRSVHFYINGFRDGHLAVEEEAALPYVWPGFLTRTDERGVTTVTVSTVRGVPVGAVVNACDGVAVPRLLDTRVHPFRTNADIPHERIYRASYLFVGIAGDRTQLRACIVTAGGRRQSVKLAWRSLPEDDLWSRLPLAQQRVIPELGLRTVGKTLFVSIPSFNWWGDGAARMQAMVDALQARIDEVHRADRVVIDVRGNLGGNSAWGDNIAAILWGEGAARALSDSFDGSVDWRTSARNAEQTREAANRSKAAGLKDDADYRFDVAARMDAARARGEQLMPEAALPKSSGLPADYRTPFAGKVFFLTDMRCASACLDFADLMRRMPGVTHVGQPTSADAVYIDNVIAPLPSGLASLDYSLKVYRSRVRKNNEWYRPAKIWPGGPMTDAALAAWIEGL